MGIGDPIAGKEYEIWIENLGNHYAGKVVVENDLGAGVGNFVVRLDGSLRDVLNDEAKIHLCVPQNGLPTWWTAHIQFSPESVYVSMPEYSGQCGMYQIPVYFDMSKDEDGAS